MARFNLRSVIQAISIENVAAGTYLTADTGTKFRVFPSDANPPILPGRTPVEDNAVGDGRAYPKQSKPYYYNGLNYPYAMALNSTMGVRLLRMWAGGAVTTTVNSAPATTDHLVEMLPAGSVPKCANVVRKLGGEAYLHGDMFVQTVEITQEGAGEPQIRAAFGNSGYSNELANTTIVTSNIATMATYLKFHGTKTKLTFTDGSTSYDYAADHRLCGVSFSGNQNVVVDQLPGDPFLNTAAECQGAYAGNFQIDVQTGQIKCKVYMDANFTEYAAWKANKKLTSVKLTFSSCEIVGATTHHFEIEIQIPVAEFNLDPDQQGNFSAYSFTIKAIEGDPTTGSLVKVRIRRATADGALDEVAP